jgi:hypothetical protein
MADKPSVLSIDDISILDKQVETLADFKPIPEHEVKLLCDKVSDQNLILDGEMLIQLLI